METVTEKLMYVTVSYCLSDEQKNHYMSFNMVIVHIY